MFNDETYQEDVTLENDIEEEVEATEEEVEVEEDSTDWKAEALKYKAILDRNKERGAGTTTNKPNKSNDFGYDVKAYLKASGIKANEFDFVKTELKRSGIKDVDALLENEYFQAGLEKFRAVSKTAEAVPRGNRSGGVATDSVEYWLTKPFEEVPADKRRDVVNAKIEKEKNAGKFYNS